MSKVYTESHALLLYWKQKARDKVRKREIAALFPAKVKVGDNFVDKSTPLVAQDFIANQTVSLILMH